MHKFFFGLSLTLFLLIGFCSPGWGQSERKLARKSRPTYALVAFGPSSSNFRDFATSPLTYRGSILSTSLARLRADANKESLLGLSYSFGNYSATVEEHSTSSQVKTLSLYYSRLYAVNKYSNEQWKVKAGALFNATVNTRLNASLQNNAFGIEMFPTLLGSIQVERDLSRTSAKEGKLLFIRYNRQPRKRLLSYRFNLGLLNSHYRNGFVYSGQSSVLNDPKLFDDYSLKTFSGMRMSSTLCYSVFNSNGNITQFSYNWDAYKTGGDADAFEMAHHSLTVSLAFNTK